MAKQRMKVRIVKIPDEYDVETVEADLNSALKELNKYFIHDIKPIGEGMIAILYFTQKRSD